MYVLHAIRRTKENTNLTHRTMRIPTHNIERDLPLLRAMIKREEGVWRIYRSVNRRDINKTFLWMQHKMLDDVTNKYYADRVDKLWTKGLMQTEHKAERKYLVDIDTDSLFGQTLIIEHLKQKGVAIIQIINTPNGIHMVTYPFDVRFLEQFDDAEVKKDALLFIERIDNND